jgi:hypothetical protein
MYRRHFVKGILPKSYFEILPFRFFELLGMTARRAAGNDESTSRNS